MAIPTAMTMIHAVTGAWRTMSVVVAAAAPGAPPNPPAAPAAASDGMPAAAPGPPSPPPAEVVAAALRVGATRFTTRMPTRPTATPTAPPMSDCTTDSPATWPTIRRSLQPIALSVPNSRVRRVTPEIVNRIVMRNAAASTMSDSQVPRFDTSVDAEASEPDTVDARSSWVLTVASGSAASMSVCTCVMSVDEAACTYTSLTWPSSPASVCATSRGM
jgi:hypothetical protein